ncbi:hypothetical protein BASA61_007037 [Batrachochytrium salamandrivorans]|nr:hypothetical protein BASA61_007037 [Batrachochytrium salamandrivorans]
MIEPSALPRRNSRPPLFQLQQVCTFRPAVESALVFVDATAPQSHLLVLRDDHQVELVEALLELGSGAVEVLEHQASEQVDEQSVCGNDTTDKSSTANPPGYNALTAATSDTGDTVAAGDDTGRTHVDVLASTIANLSCQSVGEESSSIITSTPQALHDAQINNGSASALRSISDIRFSVKHTGHLRQLKLSSDRMFIGILQSAKHFELRHALMPFDQPPLYVINRDWKISDAILGFEWTFSNEFICVTSTGIELYMYSKTKHTFFSRYSITSRIAWYIYSPEANIIITNSGTLTLTLHQLKPSSRFSQLPKLKLDHHKPLHPNKTDFSDSRGISRKQVSIVNLYGQYYISFINTFIDIPSMSLYRLVQSKTWRVVYLLDLVERGLFCLSVWDNLLIVHNLLAKYSFIFDVLSSNTSKKLVGPQAALFTLLDSSSAVDEGQQTSWACYAPDLILSATLGVLSRISLRTRELRDEMERFNQHDDDIALEVLRMLIRRTDPSACLLTLDTVRRLMDQKVELRFLRRAFDVLNQPVLRPRSLLSKNESTLSLRRQRIHHMHKSGSISLSDISDSSTSSASNLTRHHLCDSSFDGVSEDTSRITTTEGISGHFLPRRSKRDLHSKRSPTRIEISQEDMLAIVFLGYLDENFLEKQYLASCLLEYMYSLESLNNHIDPSIEELLVDTLIECSEFQQVYQFIQMGVITMSVKIAQTVLRHRDDFPAFSGLAFEAFEMLGADDDAIGCLILQEKLLQAVEYAMNRNCVHLLPRYALLDTAYTSANQTLFLNIYRAMEECGYIPNIDMADGMHIHSDPLILEGQGMLCRSPDAESSLKRFVSVYRELWSPRIDMETLQGEL